MAPRKPTKAGSTGEDPSGLGEGWSCFLGKSLVKEADLAELVSSDALVEGQGSCGGEAVVPSPCNGRTVVFAAYFAAGLHLPCDDFLSSVLATYEVRLPQLSPSAFLKLAVFAWMCRTCGSAPTAELFAVLFMACATTKDVQTPTGPRKTVFGCVNFMLRLECSNAWPVPASMANARPTTEVNRVHVGELPSQSNPSRARDDEVGTSKKRKRAVAKGGQVRTRRGAKGAVESDGEEEEEEDGEAGSEDDGFHGYTPSSTPVKSGAGSHISPTRPQDIVVANTLLAISSTAAKPGMTARRKKKKGKVVQVARGFSNSEGSDGTPTSPILQHGPPRGRRMSPPPASDAEAAMGGSASALAAKGLAAHLNAKKSALQRLDGYRLRLRKTKEDLRHKEDERRVVAETLKKANAENKLPPRPWFRPQSAKQACYTLRLPLNDLGARAEGALGEGGTVFDFSEWTQEAAGLVVEVAGAYGDCCARVSAGFVLSLLHAHGCDHIGNFPDLVKEEWLSNTQCSGAAFRKGFWEDGGRDCAKTRLRENLERIARDEEAAAGNTEVDPGPSEQAAGYEGKNNGGQDHPDV
uniref:Transposable element protein, putative, Transposase_28 n=1 Tax=Oryza sativa subsp. japonica TaxID=39947 RepID=Q2QU50_ORYSJ|nr:Transposable element protein, putative, Transposase_28 [Oryza sativa Japonica Group]